MLVNKLSYLIGLVLFLSFDTNGDNLVHTNALASGPSKVEACNLAIEYARQEAAQTAETVISARYSSAEHSNGIKHKTEELLSTQAYANLKEKSESIELNKEDGQIKCAVNATFEVGLIINDNTTAGQQFGNIISNLIGNDPVSDYIQETHRKQIAFTAGEPFCLTQLYEACFREYYAPEIKVFGIQFLGGGPESEQSIRDGRLYLIEKIDQRLVDTKEAFMHWFKEQRDDKPNNSLIFSKVKGYNWNQINGYNDSATNSWIHGKSSDQISFFSFNPDFPDKKLVRIETLIKDTLTTK